MRKRGEKAKAKRPAAKPVMTHVKPVSTQPATSVKPVADTPK